MANVTTQIRSIVDTGKEIFSYYPIFEESYRVILNQKIIDHYFFREIGLETVGQFKHFLRVRMNEIMPYYNQMYKSETIEFDPMITLRLTETFTRTNDGTSEGFGTSNATSISEEISENDQIYSDTPQAKLAALDYATNTTADNGKNNTEGTSTARNDATNKVLEKEDYEKVTVGNAGVTSDARLIMDLRKSFINIDKMIIDELGDLFLNIYN